MINVIDVFLQARLFDTDLNDAPSLADRNGAIEGLLKKLNLVSMVKTYFRAESRHCDPKNTKFEEKEGSGSRQLK